jgi:tetratricopeptide (TPR) repeat protein
MKRIFWLLIVIVLLLAAGCATKQTDLNDANAYNYRGIAYQRKGQYDRAISAYTKALEINPRIAEVYCNRGRAYFKKGQYDKAWENVHKAEDLGLKARPEFLKKLRKVSGRQK